MPENELTYNGMCSFTYRPTRLEVGVGLNSRGRGNGKQILNWLYRACIALLRGPAWIGCLVSHVWCHPGSGVAHVHTPETPQDQLPLLHLAPLTVQLLPRRLAPNMKKSYPDPTRSIIQDKWPSHPSPHPLWPLCIRKRHNLHNYMGLVWVTMCIVSYQIIWPSLQTNVHWSAQKLYDCALASSEQAFHYTSEKAIICFMKKAIQISKKGR